MTKFVKLPSGEYVEIITECEEGYKVRRWEFDEKWDAFPTKVIYTIPKEEVECALTVSKQK